MICPNCQHVFKQGPHCPQCGGVGQAEQRQSHEEIARDYAASKDRMRKKLFALGYNMQWQVPQSQAEVTMQPWARVKKRINAFLLSDKSPVKKLLDELTTTELTTVITVFEKMYRDYLKKV